MSDDQKRVLGAIGFVIVTIVIGYLLYLFFFKPQFAPQQVIDDGPAVTDQGELPGGLTTSGGRQGGLIDEQPTGTEEQEEVVEVVVDTEGDLRRLASAFAERYGSFSTASDFSNLVDLKVFMTSGMQAETDAYVEGARAQGRSAVHFGITTRALIVSLDDIDEEIGTASATVTTQRSENSGGSLEARVYYQDVVIEFVRTNDIWKVDSATWDSSEREL